MNQLPVDKLLNGIPSTTLGGNLCYEEAQSKSTSSTVFDTAPESVTALQNAFFILRDRYNRLKVENQRLVKLVQKNCGGSPNKKSLNSNAGAESNDPYRGQITSQRMRTTVQMMDSEPLSATALIGELEQLREKLDKMSKEAQSTVDADLKDMMVSVIPKLKELERQCSSLSDDGQRSAALSLSKVMHVTSVDGDRMSAENMEEERKETFPKVDQVASADFVSSFPYQSSIAMESNLNELVLSTSTQYNDLQCIDKILKQQNKKLNELQMKAQSVRKECIPEPDAAVCSSETGDWSLIQHAYIS